MIDKAHKATLRTSPNEVEDEIDITPEMIKAGITELATYSDYFESQEAAVVRIYCAMRTAYEETK